MIWKALLCSLFIRWVVNITVWRSMLVAAPFMRTHAFAKVIASMVGSPWSSTNILKKVSAFLMSMPLVCKYDLSKWCLAEHQLCYQWSWRWSKNKRAKLSPSYQSLVVATSTNEPSYCLGIWILINKPGMVQPTGAMINRWNCSKDFPEWQRKKSVLQPTVGFTGFTCPQTWIDTSPAIPETLWAQLCVRLPHLPEAYPRKAVPTSGYLRNLAVAAPPPTYRYQAVPTSTLSQQKYLSP